MNEEMVTKSDLKILEHSLKLWMGGLIGIAVSALSGLMALLRFYH